MKQFIKSLLFPGGAKPRHVLFGAGRGLTVVVDPKFQSQRLLGLAELEISEEFVEFARRCRTFCDVGASDGWYCLVVRKYNPAANIIAFEPQANLAEVAREHFRLNAFTDEGIRWEQAFCGSSGIALDDALSNAAEPIFLKIDIEGAELDALKSGIETISRKECLLLVETHREDLEVDCKQWLESLGYRVRIIPQASYRRFVSERRPLAHNRWFVASRAAG
ncbi:MAG: FkbM family methyltransferase [Usitatibacter sp.]